MNLGRNSVLLIYPAAHIEQMSVIPLSLLYVAAPLVEENTYVKIIDQRLEDSFFDTLEREMDSDLLCVGISCITGPQIEQVVKICDFIKKRTSLSIVIGGPHPTLLPEQTLESALVDYVVIGEGEAPFLNLVRALKTNEPVDNLMHVGFKKNGRVTVNRGSEEKINVTRIPYHLVSRYGSISVIPIVTSYGCPHHCSFCVEKVFHPQYVERPAQDVLFMIEDALRLNPNLVNFIDDNFLLNRGRVVELLALCEKKKLSFSWICTGRIDEVLRLDDDTLKFLKSRGLVGIFLGVESGSAKILKLINKKIRAEMVLKLNLRLKKEGIIPHYSFMAGFPGETREDFEKTLGLMRRLKRENPQAIIWKMNRYTPYPQTPLFDLAVRNGFQPPLSFEGWSSVHFYSEEYTARYDLHL